MIFTMYLERILKNKIGVLFMIVMPMVFLGFIIAGNSSYNRPAFGVVDLDNTPFSHRLIDVLQMHVTVTLLPEDRVQQALFRGRIDYGIIIPKGLTESMINKGEGKVQGFGLTESNVARPALFKLEQYLSAASNIADARPGDERWFYQGLDRFQVGRTRIVDLTEDPSRGVEDTRQGIGFLVMSMLFLAGFGGLKVVEDRMAFCLHRVLATPISLKTYMIESIGAFFLISVVQVIGILLLMGLVFRLEFGGAFFPVVLVLTLFSLVCVAFSMALASFAKSPQHLGVLSTLLVVPMCMLGGCFWPRWIMPQLLQDVGKLVPTTWVIESVEKLLRGASLLDVYLEIAILCGFAAVLFLLGTWKKSELST